MNVRARLGTATHMAVGLGVLGAAGYAFVAVVGHVFGDPADAGALNALIALYMLVNLIGPGVFAALEQETNRAVSAAAARGTALRPVARRAGVLALWSFAALAVAVLAAWPLVLGPVLEWRPGLLIALLIAIAGSGAVYWARGMLGGQQRFPAYARTLYAEGAVRLLPCLALLAMAWSHPTAYGVAFAAGSALAALSVTPLLRPPPPPECQESHFPGGSRPESGFPGSLPEAAGMGRAFLWLIGAVGLSQLLANLAPVVVTYRSPDDLVAAAVFGSTFVLARVPLFLFAPVQAMLLPHVTRAATLGNYAELTRRLWQALAVVTGLGLAGVAGCALLGPWAAEVLFNTASRPSVQMLVMLGCATLLMMLALTVQPTLLALDRQRLVTIGWTVGAVVFIGLLVAIPDPITAALFAQLIGPLVVLLILLASAAQALRAPASASAARR